MKLLMISKMLLWFLIIPEFLGLGLLKFSKKENMNSIFALVIGYIFSFMIYEILAIPMEFAKCNFTTLSYSWIFIILALFVISVILNLKNLKNIIKYNIEELKKFPKVLLVTFLIIVGIQCFVSFRYMHEDYDDSNFIAKATIARDTNTLHKFDDTGKEYDALPTRQFFSPFPFYTATMSTIIGTHPAALARSIFPLVFIPIAYLVYAMIGDFLFKGDKKQNLVFLIILTILYTFGAYSLRTNFVFLLYRVWQGKAILANIIIPLIWYIFIKYINKDEKFFYWFILFITLWGADLLSSMAISIATLTTFLFALIFSIKDKNIKYLIKSAICVIPSFVYGILYLLIKV